MPLSIPLTPCAPRGFSLVELCVALAIAAVLLGYGVPGYARWLAEQRLMDEARRLSESLALARSEAIKRNGRVQLCAAASRAACASAGGWHQGLLMFDDLDGNADVDPDERVVAFEPSAAQGVTIVGNAPVERYVSFTYSGHARKIDGALQMGTFTVCASGLRAIKVVLANSGRARIDRTAAVCP
jgi:type IV fimbrial biogenesis protein FimT